MNQTQFQASYILDGINESLKNLGKDEEIKGLLKFLSCFELATDCELNHELDDSVTSIIHNLIVRGLPTRASIFVENKFMEAFGKCRLEDSAFAAQSGSIKYKSTLSKEEASEVFSALHIIDPRIKVSANNYGFKLDSNFENDFIFEYLPNNRLAFLPQLLHSQRKLSTIAKKDIGHGLYMQRVDFSLEFPYRQSINEINSKKPEGGNDKIFNEGIIVEIDGKKFHSNPSQNKLDRHRDKSARDTNWATKRINDFKTTDFSDWIKKYELLDIFERNYNKEFDEKWVDILQLTLSPIAIARVQKTIIELIRANLLDLSTKEWNILAIERDVPCVALAIEDLKQHFEHIFSLQGKNQNFPVVNLKVLTTKEFAEAKLHGEKIELIENYKSAQTFDLIIDAAILQRSGIKGVDIHFNSKHKATIRSSHFIESERKICTSDFVDYKPVAIKTENGDYEDIPQAKRSLTFFLQNIFRKESFRPGQLPILNRAMQGKSVIGLLPTGGGKSLTYQLAGLLQPGVTIVIDPIKSLMQDQYDNLVKNGIDCCNFINSKLGTGERTLAAAELMEGKVLFTFVSPERLQIEEFRRILTEMHENKVFFSYCVIDEVHCVSEWGHDFRPSYLSLGKNVIEHCKTKNKKHIPIFGLTATASFDVLSDVERELSGNGKENIDADATIRFENINRPELQFLIVRVPLTFDRDKRHIAKNAEANGNHNQEYKASGWSKTPKPIGNDLKKLVGETKQDKLIEIIEQMPSELEGLNERSEYIVEWTKENFGIERKLPSIKIDDFDKGSFYNPFIINDKAQFKNGGIVFCPHRSNIFGVTDKFKFDTHDEDVRDDEGNLIHKKGEYILDKNGNKTKLPAHKRKGVADIITRQEQYAVGYFMGSSDDDERAKKDKERQSFDNQKKFIENELNIMVATKAFGMGIDKPNVRFTIHMNIPSSIESFVQEAGRAGRDGKVALSAILFNDQKTVIFDKNFYKKIDAEISDEAFEILKGAKIKNKQFLKEEIPEVLKSLENDELVKNERKIIASFDEKFIDKDNLLYFHDLSFRGPDKELAVLDELLDEIFTDTKTPINYIDKKLKVKFNYRNACLNLDTKKNRLYINDIGEKGYGYINLPDLTYSSYPEPFHPSISKKYLEFVISEIKSQCPDYKNLNKLIKWLTTKGTDYQDKIRELQIKILNKYEEVVIPFENKYANSNKFLRELTSQFNNIFSCSVDEATVRENLGANFDDFLRKLSLRLGIEIEADENKLAELKKLYYSPRTKEDTDKAIFRLSSIGVIDDYTIDYLKKCYTLHVAKKTDDEYIENLKIFMRKYYSASRVDSEIKNIDKAAGDTVLKKCLSFLTDFVYREIAVKRLRSIDDMILACEIGMQENGNEEMKDFIHLYFNSKYAKDNHEINGENYSLTQDTDNAKEYSFDVVWKYLDATLIDPTGAQKDNVKHLRGAALRLLRTQPNNAALMLLKGYSLFVLGIGANKSIRKEAEESFKSGFKLFRNKYKNITFEELSENIERYKDNAIQNAHNQNETRKILDKITDELYIDLHHEWLQNFNNKYLLDYDGQQ